MKILHTSDWHLGKRTDGKERLSEQQKVLNELIDLCQQQKIDVVIIAGDIFDALIPPPKAEELFYNSCLKLAQDNRIVVVLAGNHDDPERLSAPCGIAIACNIIIVSGLDNSKLICPNVKGGYGFITIEKNNERLNLALLPFPSLLRLSKWGEDNGTTYQEKISNLIEKITSAFRQNEINIFAGHIFITGSETTDERELGTAILLPVSVLPDNSIYNALGHIHKYQRVSKERNAFYCGSILQYSFDDTFQKKFIILDTDGKEIKLSEHIISSGLSLKKYEINDITEGVSCLASSSYLTELIYKGDKPLVASDLLTLKKHENFVKLTVVPKSFKREIIKRDGMSVSDLFSAFFEFKTGKKPKKQTLDTFLEIFNSEDEL